MDMTITSKEYLILKKVEILIFYLKKELLKNSINFTNSFKELRDCNFYIICVPTPITKKIPDLRFLKQSSKQIGKLLKMI